jgi:hypothetical protein
MAISATGYGASLSEAPQALYNRYCSLPLYIQNPRSGPQRCKWRDSHGRSLWPYVPNPQATTAKSEIKTVWIFPVRSESCPPAASTKQNKKKIKIKNKK